MQGLAEVDEVEDVLLEARATEADGCAQEFGADARVVADSVGDLVDVGTRRLADGGERVDRRDTLGKHRVGRELRQLRRPEADGQDALSSSSNVSQGASCNGQYLRDPVGVYASEGCACIFALLSLQRTDQDTIGLEEIRDGGSLSEELGVGKDVEPAARLAVGLEDGAHRLCSPAGHSGLLDDDLGGVRDGGDATRRRFDIATKTLAFGDGA